MHIHTLFIKNVFGRSKVISGWLTSLTLPASQVLKKAAMFGHKISEATRHTVDSLRNVYNYLYDSIEYGQEKGFETQRLEIIIMNIYTAIIQTDRRMTCRSMSSDDRRFIGKIISKNYG